jgi:two-component system sensor histidine kinase RstB
MGPLTSETLLPEPLLVVMTILICSLLLGIVYVFFRPLERRLARLTDTAAGMGQGRLDTRVPMTKNDEVGRLEKAFNRMADEIQQLVHARDELLRSVSHELRTPLQRMHFALERTHADDEKTRLDAAGRLERDVEELQGLVEELLTYARFKDAPGIAFSKLNVNEVVSEIVESHAPLGLSVVLAAPAHMPLMGLVETKLFRRALSNLVVNGIHHARSRVEVRTARQDDMIFIDVHDDGPGIPAAEQPRIFEPFRRGDAHRSQYRGYGLGLAIVKSIAERHGGHVDVATSELGGARFRLGVLWAA